MIHKHNYKCTCYLCNRCEYCEILHNYTCTLIIVLTNVSGTCMLIECFSRNCSLMHVHVVIRDTAIVIFYFLNQQNCNEY